MSDPILVTGASSGIGRAVAVALLVQGRAVIGLSRTAPEGMGAGYTHVHADLSDPAALHTALAALPPLGGLVHAAGLLRVGPHEAFDFEAGALMWRLHVEVSARLIGTLSPRLPDGGRIVLIGSRVANGAAGRALYAASKSALTGLARSCAAELAPRAITVNIVAPGATETPMLHDPARAGTPPRMPPIGRMIQPDEVAGLVAYLLSPLAGAITGQTLIICGGASL